MSTDAMFSLNELVSAAEEAMADWPAPTNRQIRAMPDVRTLRYYTHLGLLDRPMAFKGRTALYGRRHLLQVLAIKRLQFRGLSLQQIQEDLYGTGTGQLEKVVGCALPSAQAVEEEAVEASGPRSAEFWNEPVAPIVHEDRAAAFSIEPQRVTQLQIAPGTTLVLPVEHLSEEAFAELPAAIAPLQKWLAKHARRQGIKPSEKEQESGND